MGKDLYIIKKKYGEKMAHLCRELFPTLLETEGLLSDLILSKFNPDHSLYDSLVTHRKIEAFKNYIYSFVGVKNKDEVIVTKTPKELLDEAGYILYECKIEEEIQAFKRYYRSGEELCTFKGGRLNSNYVFFAIKKNVDDIKREDFLAPERQDEYGTSVISIQFTIGSTNTLSIKNRYNHTVNSPDATFSNNLDNIISGLTDSFTREYNLNVIGNKSSFELSEYVLAQDGKIYKYNQEIDNIYYCPDNIIIDSERKVERLDKSRYLLIDYFIIDLKKNERSVSLYDGSIMDSFPDYFKEKGIKNIEIINIDDGKEIKITLNSDEEVIIKVDEFNRITYIRNDNIVDIGDNFLLCNENLTSIELDKVQTIGNNFLFNNERLVAIKALKVEIIGESFLYYNAILPIIELPEIKKIGEDFLMYNKEITTINFPKLLEVSDSFLFFNENISSINLPCVQTIGFGFISYNNGITSVELPNVKSINASFLSRNAQIKSVVMPKVRIIADNFLYSNISLTSIMLPEVEKIGNDFLHSCRNLTEFEMGKLVTIGYNAPIEIRNYLRNKNENKNSSK